ncbi:MAG TPA: DUF3592 domain-containing protein [Ramlibacter sp.]|nr:DUF3592 domain-containing protein [Ramlibacter sp.]
MRNILDYLPGLVLPLLMLYFFFLIPLRRVRSARSWRETRCVIVSSSVSEDATDSGLYRIVVTYHYGFAGRYYSSSRYSFSPAATSGYRGKKRVVARLAPGITTICYVNPDNPRDAVIERGLTWDMVVGGLFAIIFLGAFFFVFWHG